MLTTRRKIKSNQSNKNRLKFRTIQSVSFLIICMYNCTKQIWLHVIFSTHFSPPLSNKATLCERYKIYTGYWITINCQRHHGTQSYSLLSNVKTKEANSKSSSIPLAHPCSQTPMKRSLLQNTHRKITFSNAYHDMQTTTQQQLSTNHFGANATLSVHSSATIYIL